MGNKKIKIIKDKLSDHQKRSMAHMVKERPCIWKLAHEDHRKHDPKANAWNEISVELGIEVHELKEAWKSLKDGLRYHGGGTKPKGKSGDAATDVEDDPGCHDECLDEEALHGRKFWDVMKFMTEEKPIRKYLETTSAMLLENGTVSMHSSQGNEYQSGTITLEDAIERKVSTEDTKNDVKLPASTSKRSFTGSNYDYQAKKKKGSCDKSADERIADSIQSLVDLRKGTTVPIDPVMKEEDKLKYFSMFLNLDRMLQKLPEETVEELNYQFIILKREEMRNHTK